MESHEIRAQVQAGITMTVLQRYFGKEILRAVLFVLVAFLALFAFFDLIDQ